MSGQPPPAALAPVSGVVLPAPPAVSVDSSPARSPGRGAGGDGLGAATPALLLHPPPPPPPPASAAAPASGPPRPRRTPAPALLAGSSAAAPFPQGDSALNEQEKELQRRLKRLYPAVNQQETPLPRSWSRKDKVGYIGLSQNNLQVHYKVNS
ncbi:hypothetical protein P7K49_023860 [Saguinus oedipus]|uniref:Uncharacterized protein n=1 Tax=Saguinus oedipus TaxID=9490 RepID=A0ABQ9UNM7_SAGOE|nr:hypothetical protein P7K49_023860 [Saguinus oedipus]